MKRLQKVTAVAVLLVAGLLLASNSAQARFPRRGPIGGFGYFSVGVRQLDVAEMNRLLKAKGFAPFSKTAAIMGGGGLAVARKWVIGGEGFGIVGRKVNGPSAEARLTGGYGFFDLGRVLWKRTGSFGALMGGFGGGGMEIEVGSTSYPESFGAALDAPYHSTRMSKGGLMAKLSLMGQFLVTRKKRGRCFNGLVIGFDAGYVLPIYESGWMIGEKNIGSGPASGITGPYLRITIGGGGFCGARR